MTNNLVTDDTRYFVADGGLEVTSLNEVSSVGCMTKGAATYFAARTEKMGWMGCEATSAGDLVTKLTGALASLNIVEGHIKRNGRFVAIINLGVPFTRDTGIEDIEDILERAWKEVA